MLSEALSSTNCYSDLPLMVPGGKKEKPADARPQLWKSSIHIPLISNIVYENESRFRIDLIHHTVLSNSQTVQPFGTLQFYRLRWKRIRRKAFDPRDDTSSKRARN